MNRPISRARLAVVIAVAMAIATLPFTVFSVLGAELIAEFAISRAELGLLATATGLVGAMVSPRMGRLTDRVGSMSATRGVLALGSVTLLGLAVSPSYAAILGAAVLCGLANGWGNPATNSLIVDSTDAGSRGVITGIKQSGVQFATFAGGALLPWMAASWGWRWATATFVVVPIVGLALTAGIGAPRRHEPVGGWSDHRLPRAVWWIAVYGAVSGLATSAIFVFLPLFAEEDQLWSRQTSGYLIAVVGLVGIVARIIWSTWSERRLGYGRTLRILGWVATGSAALLALASASVIGSWALVPAAVMVAAGSVSWNSVGMLAVMDLTPHRLVGKGTGLVLLWFLGGYALGSPIMGFSVDRLGSYTPGWVVAGLLLATSGLIAGSVPQGSTVGRP